MVCAHCGKSFSCGCQKTKAKDGKTRQKKKDDKKRIRLNTTPRLEIKQLATSEIETEVSESASSS